MRAIESLIRSSFLCKDRPKAWRLDVDIAFMMQANSTQADARLPLGLTDEDRVLVFDGVCNLCDGGVNFLIGRDKKAKIRYAAAQSSAGRALLKHFQMPIDEFNTMVYVQNRQPFVKSTAALRVALNLPLPWPVLGVGLLLPRFLRDWVYDRVAANRYRMFGIKDQCMIPTDDIRARFLDEP